MQKDGPSCPGCGLSNYEGLCPHCRGDQDAYERELVPPFETSKSERDTCQFCGGTGEVDSGGSYPWGEWISVMCGRCEGTGYE